jgi:hypothetical protein
LRGAGDEMRRVITRNGEGIEVGRRERRRLGNEKAGITTRRMIRVQELLREYPGDGRSTRCSMMLYCTVQHATSRFIYL